MIYKKSMGIVFLIFFSLLSTNADVLTWRASADQEFEAKVTIKESVTGLDSITVKPTTITTTTISQQEAAKNKSTIANLNGIPSFPKNGVDPGSTWKEKGTINYNLKAFGISSPVQVTAEVTYTVIEMTEIDSRSYYHIKAEWYPVWLPDQKTMKSSGIARIIGHSTMDLYWDDKSGCPKQLSLNEENQYRFSENTSLLTKRETTEEFKTVTDIVRERVLKQLNDQIKAQKVQNVEVKQTDEGIMLSIENIQFEAESAVLADTEKAKLKGVGALLAALKNRKLSIVGHAANTAGSNEAELVTLSTARAQSVADFLVQSGIKTAEEVIASGMGGSKPLASNDTPEGRSKNRRVEITILDEEVQQ